MCLPFHCGYVLHYSEGHLITPAAAAKSLQSCPTLCDPIDGSPPGSPVPGIFQARVLEWGAMALSELLLKPWVIKTISEVENSLLLFIYVFKQYLFRTYYDQILMVSDVKIRVLSK